MFCAVNFNCIMFVFLSHFYNNCIYFQAQDLKSLLEKCGHEVWCSVEMIDCQMNLGSEDISTTNPNTPRNLPTIQEGDVFFNQNDLELYSSGKNSVSLYREQEAYGKFDRHEKYFSYNCFKKRKFIL